MRNDNEYISIDLMKIVEGMIQRLWIIILAMIIGGVALFSYASFMVTPLYESSILLYVNNSSFSVGATSFSISSSEISAAKSLVDTYLVILKTRSTLNDVIAQGSLNYTYEELRDMISAQSVNDTEVFSITVTSPDPQEAEHIANTIARVLPNKIADIVEGSSVRIVDYAVVPFQKVSPSISKYTILGLLGGLLLSCAIIVLMEIMDDQIRSEDYLIETYGSIPLLTTVPDLLEEKKNSGYYYYRRDNDTGAKAGKSEQRRAKK